MSDQSPSHDGVEPHNHDGAEHPCKRYSATLDDIKLLADAISLLDYIKGPPPDEGGLIAQADALVERSHGILMHILGDDIGQVYAADDGVAA